MTPPFTTHKTKVGNNVYAKVTSKHSKKPQRKSEAVWIAENKVQLGLVFDQEVLLELSAEF